MMVSRPNSRMLASAITSMKPATVPKTMRMIRANTEMRAFLLVSHANCALGTLQKPLKFHQWF